MAKKPTKAKAAAQVDAELPFEEESLTDYSREMIRIMGNYTMENRAVPDYRDGLKPVQRRIMWAMIQQGLHSKAKTTKCARIVGDVIGKYHPHGDKAVYDALTLMVEGFSTPLIKGQGNFGTLLDDAAAYRYTEAKLSPLAELSFMDSDYLKVMDTAPNFDGTTYEPVVLPSKVPMALLVGAYGILFGGMCTLPSFEPAGVIELTKLALKGKPVTPKLIHKHLVITTPTGGHVYLEDDESIAELDSFYKSGLGSVYYTPNYEIDVSSRSILINGFAPSWSGQVATNLSKLAANEGETIDFIDDEHIEDPENPAKRKMQWRVYAKKSVAKADLEEVLLGYTEYFESGANLYSIMSNRFFDEDRGEFDIETLPNIGMADFFKRWTDWRIEIERKVINMRIERAKVKLAKANLHLLVVLNRELILKSLDADDSEDVLVKKLKISREDAAYILGRPIRSLKALEEKPLRTEIKDTEKYIKDQKVLHKDPTDVICSDLDTILAEV